MGFLAAVFFGFAGAVFFAVAVLVLFFAGVAAFAVFVGAAALGDLSRAARVTLAVL